MYHNKTTFRILPNVYVHKQSVYYDESEINLSRRPLTLRLIKAFLNTDTLSLNKDQLVSAVYREIPAQPSTLLSSCLQGNVQKLISRTRTLLEAEFTPHRPTLIDWLLFNHRTETWYFYKLSTTYLLEKERELTATMLSYTQATLFTPHHTLNVPPIYMS